MHFNFIRQRRLRIGFPGTGANENEAAIGDILANSLVFPGLRFSHRLRGHTGCVNALSYSPDGSLLVSGGDDLRVLLWDANALHRHTPRAILKTGHTGNIFTNVVDGNLQQILSGGNDGRLQLTDVATGKCIRSNLWDEDFGGAIFQAELSYGNPLSAIAAFEAGVARLIDLREASNFDSSAGVVLHRSNASTTGASWHPNRTTCFGVASRQEAVLMDMCAPSSPVFTYCAPMAYKTSPRRFWNGRRETKTPKAAGDFQPHRRRRRTGGMERREMGGAIAGLPTASGGGGAVMIGPARKRSRKSGGVGATDDQESTSEDADGGRKRFQKEVKSPVLEPLHCRYEDEVMSSTEEEERTAGGEEASSEESEGDVIASLLRHSGQALSYPTSDEPEDTREEQPCLFSEEADERSKSSSDDDDDETPRDVRWGRRNLRQGNEVSEGSENEGNSLDSSFVLLPQRSPRPLQIDVPNWTASDAACSSDDERPCGGPTFRLPTLLPGSETERECPPAADTLSNPDTSRADSRVQPEHADVDMDHMVSNSAGSNADSSGGTRANSRGAGANSRSTDANSRDADDSRGGLQTGGGREESEGDRVVITRRRVNDDGDGGDMHDDVIHRRILPLRRAVMRNMGISGEHRGVDIIRRQHHRWRGRRPLLGTDSFSATIGTDDLSSTQQQHHTSSGMVSVGAQTDEYRTAITAQGGTSDDHHLSVIISPASPASQEESEEDHPSSPPPRRRQIGGDSGEASRIRAMDDELDNMATESGMDLIIRVIRQRIRSNVGGDSGRSAFFRNESDELPEASSFTAGPSTRRSTHVFGSRMPKKRSSVKGGERIVFSQCGNMLLLIRSAAYPLVYATNDELPLFELRSDGLINSFTLKNGCWLTDGIHIAMGSEDCAVHIWRIPFAPHVLCPSGRRQGTSCYILNSVARLKGHVSIVNCCAAPPPPPKYRGVPILATSGIERMIRIWTPNPVTKDKADKLKCAVEETGEDRDILSAFTARAQLVRFHGAITAESSTSLIASSSTTSEDEDSSSEGGGGGCSDDTNGYGVDDTSSQANSSSTTAADDDDSGDEKESGFRQICWTGDDDSPPPPISPSTS